MKKMMIFAFILVVMLFTACSTEETVGNKEQEKSVQSETNYDDVFLSVSSEDEEKAKVQRITSNGVLVETLNDQQLLLKDGSNLVLYDLKGDKESILLENVYNGVLSFDKNTVAYEKDQGIYLMSIKDKKSELVYSLKDEVSRNFILSDDGDELILQTVKNDKTIYRLIDQSRQVKELSVETSEDFVITDFVSFFDQKLYALAELKKEGEVASEDEVYSTTDLYVIDLKDNSATNITNLKAEGDTKCLDIYGDHQLLVELMETTINSEEIEKNNRVARVDMNSGKMYSTRIKVQDPYSLDVLTDEKEYIWLEESDVDDVNYPDKHVLKLQRKNGKVETLASILSDIPSELFVEENKILFNSNGDIYLVEIVDGI